MPSGPAGDGGAHPIRSQLQPLSMPNDRVLILAADQSEDSDRPSTASPS